MPFTDDQFDRFIETITKFQDSRELLIRIDENTKSSHAVFEKHLIESTSHRTTLDNAVKALHKRVDWLMISGTLAIVFFALTLYVKLRS